MKNPAVVLSLTATGLSVVRSLGYQGVEVYGIDPSRWQIGNFSKYIKKISVISSNEDPDVFVDLLIKYSKSKNEKPVLIPTSDNEVQFVSKYSGRLRRHFIIFESYDDNIVGKLLNKVNLYNECKRLSVDIPQTFFPKNYGDIQKIENTLVYPAIIKPGFRHQWKNKLKGKKVIEVNCPGELKSQYENYCTTAEEVVVQEVIPGNEDNIIVFGGYFNREYEPVSIFTGRKLRQFQPMFGSGSLCVSEWYPEIAKMSIKLVKKLKYHGICGTEYKWDSRDNRFKFMEINFRPTLWFALTRASGVDIVYDAYLDLTGQNVLKKLGNQKNGILWQYLARDLYSFIYYARKREINKKGLTQFINPKKEYAVLSSNDWRVNLAYPFYVFYEALRLF